MSRPIGITILGVLVILASIVTGLAGLGAVLLAFASLIPGTGLPTGILFVGGLLYMVIAVILLAAGVGLLRLRGWAWWLALLTTLGVLGWTLYGWYTSPADTTIGNWATVAIAAAIVLYLAVVRRHFRKPAAPTAPT